MSKYAYAVLAVMLAVYTYGTTHAMEMGGAEERAMSMTMDDWTRDDDATFLFGMIEHHKGALRMSEAALDSRDPQVAAWARSIIADQRREIDLMQSLVDRLALTDRHKAADMMRGEMEQMMSHPHSQDGDTNFVAMMIPHHAGAIEMSVPALVLSENGEIRDLARKIILSQTEEIGEFQQWLETQTALVK